MRTLAAIFVLLLIWSAGLMAFAARADRSTPAPDPPPADGIVVLTGASGERIDAALRLLEAGKARRLLISGVGRHVTGLAQAQEAALLAGGDQPGQAGRGLVRRSRAVRPGRAGRGPVMQADLEEHRVAVGRLPVDADASEQRSGLGPDGRAEPVQQRPLRVGFGRRGPGRWLR